MPGCSRCGHDNTAGSRFCSACGAPLAAALPPSAEERKVVTVLFADVSGSTALGEELDAEGLKEVMGAFFAAMSAEIEAEGGTVEKYIGDAVMAAFGVPRVHEDDPARALRAALRMRTRLAELNEVLEERHGVALELRIGINTGEVMAVTDPRPGEALATGDAVNAAARLEQSALPGRVLVSERTAQAARGFRFSAPQLLELRGRTQPLAAVELVAEQAIAEGALSGLRAPLVGRRRELELLTTTYRRVVEEGRPHLVTLYGDAGVGKSRLVAEMLAGLEAGTPAPQVLRGRCLAYGDGISYWPLAEMLKAHAGVLNTDVLEVARRRTTSIAEQVLTDAGVDGAGDAAEILNLSIGLGTHDHGQRSPHELRAETQLAWRSFFSALAAARPTVIVVEDVQWADAAVLEVLEDVADRAAGPLLLLSTARPELTARRPTWGGGRRSFTGLVVEPLTADESERLVDLLAERGVGAPDRAAMLARAEGNPFFLEEIVRTRTGPSGTIPDTVQAALAARIDLLAWDEKRVLQAAAVVGRVFWPAAIAEVAELDAAGVDDMLDRLQDRDLVLGRLSSSMSGQREMIFKHALIRDVAYDGLPRRELVRMHGDVAAWIESAFSGRRDEVIELVAHHRRAAYEAGPTPERRAAAFAALAEAAESVFARAAFEQAQSFAQEAIGLAATALDRARVLETLGYASFARFDGSTAWDSLREAADIVREEAPADRARLARICGFAVMIPTRAQGLMRDQPPADEVRGYLELGHACAAGEDGEALVLLLAAEGFWQFGFGVGDDDPGGEENARAARRAREIAQRIGRRDLELIALDSLAAGVQVRGLYGPAIAINNERLELVRHVHDPFEVADCYYTAAWATVDVGLYRETVAFGQEYDARDVDLPAFGTLSLSALARLALGEWDEALADQARLRELVAQSGEIAPRFATSGYGTEALIHEARGDRASADAVLAEIAAWERSPRDWSLPQATMALARRGDFAEAQRLLAALGMLNVYLPRRLEARCTLIAEMGDWDAAAAVVDQGRGHAEAGGLLALSLHADRLEGRARLAGGDPAGAAASLERAVAGFARLEASWEVALTELELGRALAALGRHGEMRAVLERAAAQFARLGVQRELGQAAGLLDAAPTF